MFMSVFNQKLYMHTLRFDHLPMELFPKSNIRILELQANSSGRFWMCAYVQDESGERKRERDQ